MPIPTPTTTEPRAKTWTRAEYEQLAAAGHLQDQRVQLIDGEIIEMTPQGSRHSIAIELVAEVLRSIVRPGMRVRTQMPLNIGERSQPEPDVAIVAGTPRDHAEEHPGAASLVVEVSDSSLAFDRSRKAGLYASAGIGEFWILNLVDRCLEVHRDPVPDAAAPLGHRYRTVERHDASATVRSEQLRQDATVAVADLLP